MSIVTLGLDPIDSKIITKGYGPDYIVKVYVVDIPRYVGGTGGLIKRKRVVIVKIRREDEYEYKTFVIEDPDSNYEFLKVKFIDIICDDEKAEKISFYIKEQVEKENKKQFSFKVNDIIVNKEK
jgi:hypothetical protein